ncbi:MAG: hypothetical protein ABI406_17340 [Ktedonobacteraceae bacterium]
MSWNPDQQQVPNPSNPYGDYPPVQPPTDPYNAQQGYGPQQPYGNGTPPVGNIGQQGYGSQQPYNRQQGYGSQQPYSNGTPPVGSGGAYGPGPGSGASSMGIQPNMAAGLSYVAGWITGLVFFLLEKRNPFVRFHAMQSILFFGGLTVLNILLSMASWYAPGFLALAFGCTGGLLGLVGFVGWIVLMINGFQGKYFKLPVIGDYAERYANQGIARL